METAILTIFFAALPHKEVDTADFYKHIADGLPEPRRMRQLLTWCATRALGDKPTGARPEDASVRLAGMSLQVPFIKDRLTCVARVIQEELLKDFSTNSELSNWFGREDVNPPAVVVKKPNPKNIQNADKIKELEEQIQRYVARRGLEDPTDTRQQVAKGEAFPE
jgi:kinetochore protein Mis13/DSN1